MGDLHSHEKGLSQPAQLNTLQIEFRNLAIKTLIIVIAAWAALYLFELFVAPSIGLTHSHIQIAGTVITITIAFVIINATRQEGKKYCSYPKCRKILPRLI